MKVIAALVLSFLCVTAQADNHFSDGTVRSSDNSTQAWDFSSKAWVDIEIFWENYANRQGGLTWGKRPDYPEYDQVKEGDTLIIQLESGNCLMEFFHSRWRRANDVRRWDNAHNEYGGCPRVFE